MTDKPAFQAVDPASGEAGRRYEGHTPAEALAIARAARAAFHDWKRTSFEERAALMTRAGQVLRDRADAFASLMTDEMGKTLTEGRAEVAKCAAHCDYFAEHAARFLAEQRWMWAAQGEGRVPAHGDDPGGDALEFPLLAGGPLRRADPDGRHTAVLKHASNVPGSALALEEVFREAGFPQDVFRTLLIPSCDVRAIIEDDAISAVSLTGSVPAGRQVALQAAGVLKKSVLELGGSDAYLVLEDVDVAGAAEVAAAARMVNGGQSCIAGKRFIVVAEIREAFEAALVEAMAPYAMGDPRDAATRLGPMQSMAARDEIHRQVSDSVAKGARVLVGGEVPDRPGAWYPATVLSGVVAGMPAHDEEVFGPVAAVIEARDEADAIRIANDSPFGLGSGVLTGDPARGERIATEELDAGMSFVNQNVRSDSRLPFGGVKHSGFGRECADFGIREFVNIKSVLIHAAPTAHHGSE